MFELFKTILCLSAVGSGVVIILMLAKPWAVKRLSARLHYSIWLIAVLFMLIPFWKAVPQRAVEPVADQSVTRQAEQNGGTAEDNTQTVIIDQPPIEYREIRLTADRSIRIYDLIAYIWAAGAGVFMFAAIGSYTVFLIKKKRGSVELVSYEMLEDVKRELNIKRRIRIRVSDEAESPMLTGVFFPIIYIPRESISETRQRMILKHELTHYKSRDLLSKWLTLFVNALHWFNPFAYFLSANINQACEVACDMSVVQNMSDEDKWLYMETILDLAER